MVKNILVTGGSGFIGTNILSKLASTNLYIKSTYYNKKPNIISNNIEYIKVDLTDRSTCKQVYQDIDCVLMAAAVSSGAKIIESNPLIHLNDNILMNTIALEESYKQKVKKFIFISSNTVYPLTENSVVEEDAKYNFYKSYHIVAWMKRFTEVMCDMYSTKLNQNMDTLIIRPGNLYGPYDKFDWEKSKVVAALIRKIIENDEQINVWGDGKDIKDFLYIDDFVEALFELILNYEKTDTFNIASGIPITINEIIDILKEILNKKNLKINHDKTKPSMIPIRKININKIKNKMKWSPKTSMHEGLKKTIIWYKDRFSNKSPEDYENDN
tara:strand:- start:37 stop:1017 length:981 start_codon:yes stop_codon:yes gene_type:complete